MNSRIAISVLGLLAATALATAAHAQEPPDTADVVPDAVRIDRAALARDGAPSPGGAFARSLLVPGWGQLYVGTPVRAGVFITLQGTSYAMLAKSLRRLDEIRVEERARAAPVRDSIIAAAQTDTALAREIEDPFRLEELVGLDPDVGAARQLVTARRRHRQDWIAYTIVFTLASGIDALVSAHLAGFPVGVTAEPRPTGGIDLQLTVPVGGRR